VLAQLGSERGRDIHKEKAVTETTTKDQIDSWRAELASAMADQQWQQALKLCSWLRYTLDQQGRTDPKLEPMHQQAKEALADQVAQERAQKARQQEHRRLRRMCVRQTDEDRWIPALDNIASLLQHSGDPQDTLSLLQALKTRLSKQLSSSEWRMSAQATAVQERFSEVLEQIRNAS
jgi:hypothetical protein